MSEIATKHTLNPNTWIDKYADYLFNYAVVRVNNSDTAKDLVQETFFAGLKSAKNFEGKATERTWCKSKNKEISKRDGVKVRPLPQEGL